MAMTDSGKGGAVFGINVTPLIDVLLVLLIIFMVIVPVTPKGLNAQVPQPAKLDGDDDAIVLTVSEAKSGSATYRINQQDVAKSDLLSKLSTIYANRAERVLFIRSEGDVEYQQVAEAVDTGRSAGVDHVAFITPKIAAGL